MRAGKFKDCPAFLCGVLFAALALLCPVWLTALASDEVYFTDITAQANLRFKHENAATGQKFYVETIGPGCAFLDYDNDGYLDVYLVNGAILPGYKPARPISGALFRNNKDGTFTDVTAKAGVAAEGIYGMGVSVGDYNNDGNADLYVSGYLRSALFKNNGDGTFTESTVAAKVANPGRWGTSAAFLDYDNDGFLDLFVANYVDFALDRNLFCGDRDKGIRAYCHPREFDGAASVLYHNDRNGTFSDVSQKAGISGYSGKGLGVVTADIDEDGYIDIFVANDGVANFLYHNNRDGTFKEIAAFAGAAYNEDGQTRAGMGVDIADYNHDGRPDILVANFKLEGAALYRNDGNREFSEVSIQSGLRKASFAFVGWGTKFLDYDNDGDRDIVIVNGHPDEMLDDSSRPVTAAQPKLLLANVEGRFLPVSSPRNAVLSRLDNSRGAAFGDFDNDGDIDVLIANNNGSPTLLRNDGGNRKHWIKLKLIGTTSNRDGVGARVKLIAGDQVQVENARGGGSYLAAHDPRLHFGLGSSEKVDAIEVTWPSGKIQRLSNSTSAQILTLREP